MARQGRRVKPHCFPAAFTLVEVLVVVGLISILATGGYMVATGVQESSRVAKLESDVAVVNNAIQLHVANGGALPEGSEQAIVDELKKPTVVADQTTRIGFRASHGMVDRRLAVDTSDPGTGRPRAVWNAGETRFEIVTAGDGVRRFYFDDAKGAEPYDPVTRPPTLDADGTDWIWTYVDAGGPTPAPGPGGPATGTAPAPTTPGSPTTTVLTPPTFTPSAGGYPIFEFPINVEIIDPNPAAASQIRFRINGGGWLDYFGGTIAVAANDSIEAYASAEKDPNNYSDSGVAVATYTGAPYQLEVSVDIPFDSATYFELGGPVLGGGGSTPSTPQATIQVTNLSPVPTSLQNTSNFEIYYTTDGSDPLGPGGTRTNQATVATVDTDFSKWASGQLRIRAAAKAVATQYFLNSAIAEDTATAQKVTLSAPYIDPPSTSISADLPVRIYTNLGSEYPAGLQTRYTLDGSYPGVGANGEPTSGTSYVLSEPFTTGTTDGNAIVRARFYAPAQYYDWFNASSVRTSIYTSGAGGTGAVVSDATINGTYIGSLIVASTRNFNLNSGATIKAGNLYVRGTPSIILQGGVIQGRQFLSDGSEVIPATDTRTIVDLTGPATPSNYFIRLNSGSTIEGKVYRRVNVFSPPTVPAPPGPNNGNHANINSPQTTPINPDVTANINLNSGAGDITLLPGNYGSINTGSSSAIVLGVAGSTSPTVYNFQNLNVNSGSQVKVIGPVILTLANGVNLNSAIMGNPEHPEWLTLRVHRNSVTVNSSGQMFADLNAPSSNIQLNGTFRGSVIGNSLTVNGQGVAITQATITGDDEEEEP